MKILNKLFARFKKEKPREIIHWYKCPKCGKIMSEGISVAYMNTDIVGIKCTECLREVKDQIPFLEKIDLSKISTKRYVDTKKKPKKVVECYACPSCSRKFTPRITSGIWYKKDGMYCMSCMSLNKNVPSLIRLGDEVAE
jgi:hypothetical protein